MGEQSSDYHRGEMDIQEQVATFDLFMALTKWGSLATTCVKSLKHKPGKYWRKPVSLNTCATCW